MPKERKPYYITTAIAYTSRKPHIGNSYEVVLSDAMARFRRLQGRDVFFMTGTDEHGQKIEGYAAQAGVSPKEYVDGVAAEIRAICDRLNVSYDKFIRTTDEDHMRVVQKIFKKLYDQGDIYKGEYSGHYCVACESFFTDSQLVDGKCPDCGGEVKIQREEAYFFKLSKYQKRLEEHMNAHPEFITPVSRKNEMINNFLKPGLQDLCVSRSSFKWGIPVSFDDKHVIYVWIDALSNYITGVGYDPDGSSELFEKYWPADVHVIGKDIIRFHTIYWPIELMALGLPLPKQIYGHPWLLFGDSKMSKSKGNVIYADDLAGYFGVDAVRWYLLAEMPRDNDGSITYDSVVERYNSDLANTIGNLVSRTVAMIGKYQGGVIKKRIGAQDVDAALIGNALSAVTEVEKCFDEFRVADAAAAVLGIAKSANKYIDETAPWILGKDPAQADRLAEVLYGLAETIRIMAVELSPFMPDTSKQILEAVGCPDICSYESASEFGALPDGAVTGSAAPIFVRFTGERLDSLIRALGEKAEAERAAEKSVIESIKKKDAAPAEAGLIDITDFAKVELRAAKVLTCEKVEKSKKLLRLILDDGSGEERVVASGIAAYYTPEELVGKTVAVVANLKPATLCGVESRGMILAADAGDGVKVVFLDGVPAGSKIR
ncbi:MAG: methionine--tRNA ligase [Clostridia bacterium]|nr:methionine--tRNA ligase [Clostridia bacterium]